MSGPARIPVTVHDGDPLIHAGLTCLLQGSPLLDVRDPAQPGAAPGGVAVLVAERMQRLVLTTLRRLSRTGPVVLIVADLDERQLLRVLDHGVAAIVLRHQVTQQRLVDAVRAAARNDADLPRDAVGHLVNAILRLSHETPGPDAAVAAPPSDRELEVLRFLADGLETREVADRLAVSERTVKNVLHGVTARYRLRNRTHAVAHALREGYL